MAHSLLFVHSPLLGPASLVVMAAAARERGIDAAVPDLRGFAAAPPPRWNAFVELAVEGAAPLGDAGVVVLGHSGAGVMLPTIADRLVRNLRALVFMDAVVPPAEGHHRTPPAQREMLDAQTTEGTLASWFDWWPPETIAEIVPDESQRAVLASDAPRLPRAFYDELVPVPLGWSAGPIGYLQLSAAYDADRNRATERGWPAARLDGTHLSPATEPIGVLDAICELVERL